MKRNQAQADDGTGPRGARAAAPGMPPRSGGRSMRFALVGVAIVALIGLVAGASIRLKKDTPAKQLERAKSFIAAGQHRSAILEIKQSLQGDPAQPAVRFMLGSELAALGDHDGAQIEFRKAVHDGLPADRVAIPLARSALKRERYQEVVDIVNNTSLASPESNAALQTLLGAAYLGLGKDEGGLAALAAAKDLVPGYPDAAISEARYRISKRQYDQAEAIMNAVSATVEHPDEVMALRGDIAFAQAKSGEARKAYEAAIKLNPANMVVRLNLAQTAIELGDLDLAQDQMRVILSTIPENAKVQYVAALVAYLRNDFPTAQRAITDSLQMVSHDGYAQLLAGIIDIQTDNLLQAEAHLRESLAILPRHPATSRILAQLYLQRHETAKADDVLRTIDLSLAANASVLPVVAQVVLRHGQVLAASKLFDQLDPANNDSAASLVRASLRFAAGNTAAGFAQLAAASKAHPEDAEIDALLIFNHLVFKQPDAALEAWQRLSAKQPAAARTFQLRALIELQRRNRPAAREAFEKALSLDPQAYRAVVGLVDLDIGDKRFDQARARLRAFAAISRQPFIPMLTLARVEAASGASDETVLAALGDARKAAPRSVAVAREEIAFHASRDQPAQELAAVERGLAIAPNEQDFLSRAGELYRRDKRLDRAIVVLTRLTALNSERSDYAVQLGMTQLAARHGEDALGAFRNAVRQSPKRIDLQVGSMRALLDAGLVDEAGRLLFEISQAAPESPALAEYDGDVKVARSLLPESIASYRRAMLSAPNSLLIGKLARALDLYKQSDEATLVYTDWLAAHPKDELVTLLDAQHSTTLKDYGRAAAGYRRVLDRHPDDARLLNGLAWVLFKGDDPAALAYAKKAATLKPDDPEIADTLGLILLRQGQATEGIALLSRATVGAPKNAEIRFHLGQAQFEHGQKDAARKTLKAVVESAPVGVEARQAKLLLAKP